MIYQMKKIIVLFTIVLFMAHCENKENAKNHIETTSQHKYTPEMVVNKKDFVCGMPTTAGISDTAHYKGDAYGFCSAECKAAFQQDPASYIASK